MNLIKDVLTTTDEILIVIIAAAFVMGLIFLAVIAFLAARGRTIFRQHLSSNDYNVRIFTYDYDKNLVNYFDRKDMTRVVTVSLESFYQQFPQEDAENIRSWIHNIIEGNDKSTDYLEASVYLKKRKTVGFSLYELTSIDRNRKIIHFESQLLPSLSEHGKKRNIKSYIKSIDEIQNLDYKRRQPGKGAILVIKFFSVHSFEIDDELVGPLMIQLINHLATILNINRYLITLNPTEIAVYDYEASSRAAVVGLASKIKTIADSFLSLSSYDESYVIAIGMVIREKDEDIKALVGHGREMAIIAEQKEDIGFELYEPDKDYSTIVGSSAYREIVSLIRNKTVRYYFTPIIDVSLLDIDSYFLSIEPYGTSFENFSDLLEDASDLRLLRPVLKTFFAGALEQIDPNHRTVLFIKSEISCIEEYIHLTESYVNANIFPVFCFNEDLLVSYNENYEDLAEMTEGLKQRNLLLGLIINNEDQQLSPQILDFFDYFIIGGDFTENLSVDNRQLVTFRTLLDVYSRLKGTIIATDLKTIGDAEIANKIGVHRFSCLEIADASSTLEKLDSLQKEKVAKYFNLQ